MICNFNVMVQSLYGSDYYEMNMHVHTCVKWFTLLLQIRGTHSGLRIRAFIHNCIRPGLARLQTRVAGTLTYSEGTRIEP